MSCDMHYLHIQPHVKCLHNNWAIINLSINVGVCLGLDREFRLENLLHGHVGVGVDGAVIVGLPLLLVPLPFLLHSCNNAQQCYSEQ